MTNNAFNLWLVHIQQVLIDRGSSQHDILSNIQKQTESWATPTLYACFTIARPQNVKKVADNCDSLQLRRQDFAPRPPFQHLTTSLKVNVCVGYSVSVAGLLKMQDEFMITYAPRFLCVTLAQVGEPWEEVSQSFVLSHNSKLLSNHSSQVEDPFSFQTFTAFRARPRLPFLKVHARILVSLKTDFARHERTSTSTTRIKFHFAILIFYTKHSAWPIPYMYVCVQSKPFPIAGQA